MSELDGKVCVVTGGAGAIGSATAREMARRGARVVISDLGEDAGVETVLEIERAGGQAVYLRADVTVIDDVEALMRGAVDAFGRLDVLHNNAGVHDSTLTDRLSGETLPEDVWDRVMDVNLKAAWRCSRAAFPFMRDGGGGSIVNVGSTGSFVAGHNATAYAVSKAAVLQLTRALATDWGRHGIRVNCCCPGVTESPMVSRYDRAGGEPGTVLGVLASRTLLGRIGRPEEIAKLVCFLASDDASYVTGASCLADGGTLAWRGQHEPA